LKKRAKARTQITPEWRPADQLITWVKGRWAATDPQIATELEKFRDHHKGNGSVKADWDATWRTWWNNGYHRIPLRPQGSATVRLAGPPPLRDG
jgi:hypothetical protein